ncbi:MAG: hypothetical protein JWQ28_2346 [Pedobacter sp.]|jgi:ketosteroid isomerase-like protein|nr:hypothetical protein [Pedobacter sp.]
MLDRETVINNYLNAYNTFDIEKMMMDLDEDIVFENISNGEVSLLLKGCVAFKDQAEQAEAYFSSREQKVTSFNHSAHETYVGIDYHAILAMDFPNGMKKGDELTLKGKSIFQFKGNKIIRLTDIS